MPRYYAACFDLDGTLIDTTPLHLSAEAETLRAFGIDPSDPRRPWTFGLGDFAGMKLLADAFELDHAHVMDTYVPLWWRNVEAGADLRPGALELLTECFEQGVPMALVTSGDRGYVETVFRTSGIGRFFRTSVSMDDVTHMKPHPEPYMLAASQLQVGAASCVGFEDSPAGLESVRAAGMYSVAVVDDGNTGGADLVVGGPDQIDGKMVAHWFE